MTKHNILNCGCSDCKDERRTFQSNSACEVTRQNWKHVSGRTRRGMRTAKRTTREEHYDAND